MKEHQFVLAVKTSGTRKSAELAVLAAFAARKPDDCEFHLKSIAVHKAVWMAGAHSGSEAAYDLIMRSLENMGKTLRLKRAKAAKKAAP